MIQDESTTAQLQNWWHTVSFPGKNCCHLQETGDLILFPGSQRERVLVTLSVENADAVVESLVTQFPDVQKRLGALQEEWEAAADKRTVEEQVSRCRTYLLEVQALGDFNPVWQQIEEWEGVLEELMERTYHAKLQLVQQAEALKESDNWKDATQFYRNISEQWKQLGYLPKRRSDELWKRLEEARDVFFDRKRAHADARGEEMLLNLDVKLELVERAERLALSENWKETSQEFRDLMDEWKASGRTMPEKNEELWQRFITAKNIFYDRKRDHYEAVQREQEANYLVKLALVEEAERLKESTNWNQTSEAFGELTERWKNAGRVPVDKMNELRSRFTEAREYFFKARRQHYEELRSSLQDNYEQKKKLLEEAEQFRESDQWHTATEELNRLMAAWKQIGPVPHKYGNTLWKQFLEVRTEFFKRKDEHRKRRKQHAERHQEKRKQQAAQFMQTLKEELKEEEDKLEDFREGLDNITPGLKAEELRTHLLALITQCEQAIERKQQKIAEVQQQVQRAGGSLAE